MTYWLSKPIESLFRELNLNLEGMSKNDAQENVIDEGVKYLVIGSGYGAAMAALAILERTGVDADGNLPEVWIFERGDEYVPGDFPKTVDDRPRT